MAGLGFKDFQVGEVLTSSDVDGYLMQQTVMRFADVAARGSALGTATGTAVPLSEGMVSYIDAINNVQVYDGTDWVSVTPGIGNNAVQTIKSDTFTTTSTSYVDVTDLSVSITPSSATSKILVLVDLDIRGRVGFNAALVKLLRDSTDIYIGDAASNRQRVWSMVEATSATAQRQVGIYLDSPATTSAVTYKVQTRTNVSAETVFVNRTVTDTDLDGWGRFASSITAIEVAA